MIWIKSDTIINVVYETALMLILTGWIWALFRLKSGYFTQQAIDTDPYMDQHVGLYTI